MATNGTNGKDTLIGGTGNVDDTLLGFLGDDTYTYHLGSGTDTVIDSGGADTLLLGDPDGVFSGMDIYRSTSGTDLVFDFGASGKVILQKQFSTSGTAPDSRIEFLSFEDEPGSKLVFANGLKGTSKNDFIVGKASADNIAGGAGDDWIFGGAGKDTLSGGDGDDEIHGGLGNDQIDGGAGDDYLEGGAGNDTLSGGDGHDDVSYFGQSAGIFFNTSGITQTFNNRSIASGKVYEKATNTIDTLNSIESVEGTSHADVVAFGLPSTNGSVSVSLGQGNDTITGTLGGAGSSGSINVGYWDDPNGVIVNLSNSAIEVKLSDGLHTVAARSVRDGWGDTDTLQFTNSQQIYIGDSDHDDYIRGRDDSDTDLIWEWFNTGRGNDTIDGGTGTDTVSYQAWDKSNFGAIVNLSQKSITVRGVTVQSGTARDNWGGTDTLLNIENINGSNLADYLLGSDGANNLQGGAGKDTLMGGAGNDNLRGDDGNDLIIGGAGGDYMEGGAGNDVFKFNSLSDIASSGGAIDYISNFVVGEDKIDLSAIDANSKLAGKQGFVFVDGTPTTYTPGQIWVVGGSVMINTDKDSMPEYQFYVGQQPGQPSLSVTDFIF